MAFPQCFQWQGNNKLHEIPDFWTPLAKALRAAICSEGVWSWEMCTRVGPVDQPGPLLSPNGLGACS